MELLIILSFVAAGILAIGSFTYVVGKVFYGKKRDYRLPDLISPIDSSNIKVNKHPNIYSFK